MFQLVSFFYRKIIHRCLHLILENETRFGLYLASLKVKEYEFIKQEVALGCFKESDIIQFIYSVMRLGNYFLFQEWRGSNPFLNRPCQCAGKFMENIFLVFP